MNPNHLHITTYGSRTVCNPGKPGTPPKTPVEGAIGVHSLLVHHEADTGACAVPGSILKVNPEYENHARFWGIGGAQAEPSLQSRGMPRSMIPNQGLASDKCDGWEVSHTTGRGFAGEKGKLPADYVAQNEALLGEVPEHLAEQ